MNNSIFESEPVDISTAIFKLKADSLVNEVKELKAGNEVFIHHINGDKTNKLIFGTSGKGKSLVQKQFEEK